MDEQSVDSKAAAALLRILRGHLASDPEGRVILARFEQDPEKESQALAGYLRQRLDSDDAFAQNLAAAPGLPASLRTVVYGGQVERIIQIAQAGTVIVSPREQKGLRYWPILTALVVIVGLSAFWLLHNRLSPMPDGFNIAVAQFAMRDATGQLPLAPASQEVSDWLFEAITKEVNLLPSPIRVNLRGPKDIKYIPGDDSSTRAANAAQVAKQHNATIVIYGVVNAGQGDYSVEPEFFISGESFSYGSEVAGPNRLGRPVAYKPPLNTPGTLANVNEKLYARAQALRYLVAGLAYLYVDKYDDAWASFKQAQAIESWQDSEGKEVIYLLIGAARLRSYDQETDTDRRVQTLAEASDAFAQAYRLDPGYARSYLGLGTVALQQATLSEPVDAEKLETAVGYYMAARNAPERPPLAYVDVKASYGLGEIHRLGYEYGIRGYSGDEAQRLFKEVIAAYDATQSPDLLRLAGSAHAALGWLAGNTEDWPTMLSECRTAIETLRPMPRDHLYLTASYRVCSAYAEEKLGRLDDARNDYRQAIQEGQGKVPTKDLEDWQRRLEHLEKGTH